MKTYAIEIMPDAYEEIQEQFRFIAADNANAARAWVERLWDSIQGLDALPHRHPVTPESDPVGKEIRRLVFGNHFVFYHVNEVSNRVEILRFRHAARRPDAAQQN